MDCTATWSLTGPSWPHATGNCYLSTEDENQELTQALEIPSYRLLGVLGEGGMGRVYLAEHVNFERRIAIKVAHLTKSL